MTDMTDDEAFAELRRRGARRAVVRFSGLTEVEHVELYDVDGAIGELPTPLYTLGEPDLQPKTDPDSQLSRALQQPLWDTFRDHYAEQEIAEGELTWDVTTGKIELQALHGDYVHVEDVRHPDDDGWPAKAGTTSSPLWGSASWARRSNAGSAKRRTRSDRTSGGRTRRRWPAGWRLTG
jgi:hypothetical protein